MTPPHDLELEVKIIKTMIEDKDSLPIYFEKLSFEDFYNNINGKNFITAKEDYKETGAIDASKFEMISTYTNYDGFNTSLFAPQFAKDLINLRKLRHLHFLQTEPIGESAEEYIKETMKKFSLIEGREEEESSNVKDVASKQYDEWCRIGTGLVGLSTGIEAFDSLISGYCPGHYWVIGAYTNYGKTSLACFMVAQFLKTNPDKAVAFFSIEMSKGQIFDRIMTQYSGEPIGRIRGNPDTFIKQVETLSESKLNIYDSEQTVEAIRLKLLGLKFKGELPSLVFIDFIQNMMGEGSEYEQMTRITIELQALARKLKTTLVVLSQVSNEGAKSTSAVIPFKGSGAIAASADLGVLLLRDKEKEQSEHMLLADLVAAIPKNRHGRAGQTTFYLDPDTGVITYNPKHNG